MNANPRDLALALVKSGAEYLLMAPKEGRDEVLAIIVKAFREGCLQEGMDITDEDLRYYRQLVVDRVAQIEASSGTQSGNA